MGENIRTILLATGQIIVDEHIRKIKEIEVVGNSPNRESVESYIEASNPRIVIIGEGLQGYLSIPQLILNLKKKHENTRFIYLAGEIDQDEISRIEDIKSLIEAKIFDIVYQGEITRKELVELILEPKTGISMEFLPETSQKVDDDEIVEHEEFSESPQESEAINQDEELSEPEEKIQLPHRKKNATIITISSIKPGTGKSFMAVNLAASIAEYGVNMADGSRPRVALIEADLQNLSIGTILQIDDKDSRLLETVKLMKKIMDEREDIIAEENQVLDTNREIHKCFIPFSRIKNLEILAGSQLTYNDVQRINGNHYAYLIEAMKKNYDYIIIDANSSMMHASSLPILKKADICYYILNLDFNNIRNNIRYRDVLKNINIDEKVKYILNEDVISESVSERLDFGKENLEELGFTLEAAIPSIPKTIFNNRLFQGIPLVLGNENEVMDAKREIFKVANQVHPIKNYSEASGNDQKKRRIRFKR